MSFATSSTPGGETPTFERHLEGRISSPQVVQGRAEVILVNKIQNPDTKDEKEQPRKSRWSQ